MTIARVGTFGDPAILSRYRPTGHCRKLDFVFLGAEQWFAEQPSLLQRRQPVLGRDPLVEVMLKLGCPRDLVDESGHAAGGRHGGDLSGAPYERPVAGLQRDGELADHGVERPHEFLAEFVVDFEAPVEPSSMDLAHGLAQGDPCLRDVRVLRKAEAVHDPKYLLPVTEAGPQRLLGSLQRFRVICPGSAPVRQN